MQKDKATNTSYAEGSQNTEKKQTRNLCRKKPQTPKTVKEAKAPEDHTEEKRQ